MNVQQLRQAAQKIWESALHAANPATCIERNIEFQNGELRIAGAVVPPDGRLLVVGAGKATARMAQVVEEILGDRISGGLIVTKYQHGLPLRKIRQVEAGHPIPDAQGVAAVREMRQMLQGLTPQDVVLCLMSGGGSALWPAPADGITLEQKQDVTAQLLRAGATIVELNAVRKHLSAVKGGQLVKWAAPAKVISLIMSDVIGDPLDFIASGPTAPDTTTFADAQSILQKYRVKAPDAVASRIDRGTRGEIADTPKPGDAVLGNVTNAIIANNRLLTDAASQTARALGFNTMTLGTELEGEAKDVGGLFAAVAREIGRTGNPLKPPACVLAAGETTVTVHGNGKGGRNQEMALAWAISTAARTPESPCCFASVATDGTDGPTDAAGGVVDPASCARAIANGVSPQKLLASNSSYDFLKATNDLILTGPTQTNLMDIQILLVG